ncbi:MAG: DUF4303 domain-containing protein [Bacteroidota bacterium]
MNITDKIFFDFKAGFKSYLIKCYQSGAQQTKVTGIGVFTDSDMSNFVVYINSKDHLTQRNAESTSRNEMLTNKWWLPEWWWESNALEEGNLIDELERIFKQLEFKTYKNTLFSVYCQVLEEIKNEINADNDFVLLVQVSDNFEVADKKYYPIQ